MVLSKLVVPSVVIYYFPNLHLSMRNKNSCASFCVLDNLVKPHSIFTMWLHVMQCSVLLSQFCLSIRPSVRPSICLVTCLSDACIMTKLNDALQIFWYHTKGQSLCYFDTNSGWSATLPSLRNLRSKSPTTFEKRRSWQISAHNVSNVRDSEKSSITTNIKSTPGFPTSYRWSA